MYDRINKTIAAPATTPGTGAISTIRVSGPDALKIVDTIVEFVKGTTEETPGYRIKFGKVLSKEGETIDEVLVSIFHSPKSYTGEDMAEISCHASSYIVSQIMMRLVEEGALPAEPGEFTKRAFTAGKMDLAQAEAVADVIAASSAASLRVALNQLKGGFSNELKEMRAKLLDITSLLELELGLVGDAQHLAAAALFVDGAAVSGKKELQSVFAKISHVQRECALQMFIRADCRLSFARVFEILNAATSAGIWRHYLVGCADEKTGSAKVVPINLPCP